MSHLMTALAMRQQGLKPSAKIVLYWLADHHNSDTGRCFPSLRKLAEECEMDKSTVVRNLAVLEDAGLIVRVTRSRENGSQTSTEYSLNLQQPLSQNATAPVAKCNSPPVAKCDTHNLVNNNLVTEPSARRRASEDHGFDGPSLAVTASGPVGPMGRHSAIGEKSPMDWCKIPDGSGMNGKPSPDAKRRSRASEASSRDIAIAAHFVRTPSDDCF